jgi:hypothetical protein
MFFKLPYSSIYFHVWWRWGGLVTNKFLSEIFLDPGSLVRRLTSLRLSTPHESKAVCFLHLHK